MDGYISSFLKKEYQFGFQILLWGLLVGPMDYLNSNKEDASGAIQCKVTLVYVHWFQRISSKVLLYMSAL